MHRMTPASLADGVATLLAEEGEGPVLGWEPTTRGMNSVTVRLQLSKGARIAKWVPGEAAEALRNGALVAEELAAAGVRSGAPLRWRDGGVIRALAGGAVAVLDMVDGEPLTPRESDQVDWGRALGTLHSLLPCPQGPMDSFLAAVGLMDPLPPMADWVHDALAEARDDVQSIGRSRWVQLHTDPTPDAFRRAPDGAVGIIDWTGTVAGPALYDVASAVMYAGGRERAGRLLDAYYDAVGACADPEHDELETFGRVRAVVQAVYFSRRLSARDLTGVDSHDENERGLDDARRMVEDGRRTGR